MTAAKSAKGKEPERETVDIHGKEYETVASRVNRFRWAHPITDGWSIRTQLLSNDASTVIIKAAIMFEEHVLATGHAIEKWGDGKVNTTSALENCETSAIGRCLAAAGWAGSEFASADEVAQGDGRQADRSEPRPRQQSIAGQGDGRQADRSEPRPRQQRRGNGGSRPTLNCPSCGSAMWDNRAKIANGQYKSNAASFSCKDKENCGIGIWEFDRDGVTHPDFLWALQELGEAPSTLAADDNRYAQDDAARQDPGYADDEIPF